VNPVRSTNLAATAFINAHKLTALLDTQARLPVSIATFGRRMQERWQSHGNIEARGLAAAWLSLAKCFNAAMTGALAKEYGPDRWHVRQEPTGLGKTETLSLWLSLIPQEQHHGALIVVRTIHQAEEMVKTIRLHNPNASVDVHHSGNSEYETHRLAPTQMQKTATLIVAHAMYEKGAGEANNPESTSGSLFKAFHLYDGSPTGYRRMVTIDESIEFVSFVQVTLDDLQRLLFIVDTPMCPHLEQIEALRRLRDCLYAEKAMENAARQEGDPLTVTIETEDNFGNVTSTTHAYQQRFATLWGSQGLSTTDLTPLRRVVEQASLDYRLLGRKAPASERRELRERLLDTLTSAQRTLHNWAFYAREDGREDVGATLYTASVLPGLSEIPADKRPTVLVLDATAAQSPLYSLFNAIVHPVSGKTRTYRNAELNVARVDSTGKRFLTNHAAEEVPKLLHNLQSVVPDLGSQHVFILCHKGVAPEVLSLRNNLGAKSVEVGTYGNVNGRNDYNRCNVGVLFGMFRYPSMWATACYFALKGPQGWRWYYSEEGKSIKQSFVVGQLATETIQGLNRTATRRCVSVDGDCPPVKLFVTLPKGSLGDEILARVKAAMPGIREKTWSYNLESIDPRKLKRSDIEEALIAHLGALPVGKTLASEVRSERHIGQKTWDRIIAEIRRPGSNLGVKLQEIGVSYVVEGVGRGARSYFVKERR
jgi:hypothetical protein